MRGSITRRGPTSWRLKFDLKGDTAGQRETRYVTVRGGRADAEKELTRLLSAADGGTLVDPSRVTVGEYIRAWLDGDRDLSGKTKERYRELAEGQIAPHLGAIPLQRLRPSTVEEWHKTLLRAGGRKGGPLSARTVGHAHRLLRRALQRAVKREELARNVASAVSPPRLDAREIEILDPQQIAFVLERLQGHPLYVIVALALATGMRRGELLGLQLGDLDLDRGTLRVERSLEETAEGLRLKPPKSKAGRRTISLPASTVAMLRDHRRKLLETRLLLGMGKPDDLTLLFANPDGAARSPSNVTVAWRWACKSLGLPRVSFHALRHTHASALIAAKLDVVQISKRLGHANAVVTLSVYAHLFDTSDAAAAAAIEAVMGTRGEQ